MQSQQLLPKGEVLQDEALSGSQETGQPAEEVPKQHNHLEKCTGSLKNGRPAKLLNVHTHEVLARDTPCVTWLDSVHDKILANDSPSNIRIVTLNSKTRLTDTKILNPWSTFKLSDTILFMLVMEQAKQRQQSSLEQ